MRRVRVRVGERSCGLGVIRMRFYFIVLCFCLIVFKMDKYMKDCNRGGAGG